MVVAADLAGAWSFSMICVSLSAQRVLKPLILFVYHTIHKKESVVIRLTRPKASQNEPSRVTAADWARVISNVGLALFQPITPYFANQIGGIDIAERSDGASTLFTPPDFVFAVWGPIFISMIVYSVYQAVPKNWNNARLRRIGWFTATAMALNTLWMFVATLVGLGIEALVVLFAMLAALNMAFFKLKRDKNVRPRQTGTVVFPVSIFTAWITVACIAGAFSWLRNEAGFDGAGLSDSVWVVILSLAGAGVAALVMIGVGGNIFYASVFVWALGGIAFKCAGEGDLLAMCGAIGGIIIVTLTYIVTHFLSRNSSQKAASR